MNNTNPRIPDVTLATLENRFGYLLRRAYQTLKSNMENSENNRFDLTSTQHAILTVIHEATTIDQASIAKRLVLDRTTTGLAIKNLEKKQLVTRVPAPEDRRRKLVALSAIGHDSIADIQAWALTLQDLFNTVYDESEQKQLKTLLRKLINHSDGPA